MHKRSSTTMSRIATLPSYLKTASDWLPMLAHPKLQLLSSPGRVFSRTRILNKIWGYDSDPLANVVDVYIRRLRGKMRWDRDTGWIRTIRSYGYCLDPEV